MSQNQHTPRGGFFNMSPAISGALTELLERQHDLGVIDGARPDHYATWSADRQRAVEAVSAAMDRLRVAFAADNATSSDLLTALQGVMRMIAIDGLIPESVSYMRQARAVIAKATGETG